MSYVEMEGTHRVMFGPNDDVPIGAILPGDCRNLQGKVIRLRKQGYPRTIHLVTDARYEEGETTLSFIPGTRA